jgi:predicted Zn-dependent protease
VVKHDEYLDRLDGIVFGDDPEEGIVRDNLFLHPSMRLSIAFPLDWPISNGQEQVVARHPAAAQYVVLQMLTRTQGSSIADVAKQHVRQAGLRQTQGRETVINGQPAYIGTYDGHMKPIGTVRVRAAHVQVGRRVFFVAGVAKPDLFDESAAAFDAAIASVHELSAREASALRPNVVRLYTARAGDSWQSIAARQGHNIVRASTLAIMNGHPVNEQPIPGERIKIVVEGT